MNTKLILSSISPIFLLFLTNVAFAHHGGPHEAFEYTPFLVLTLVGLLIVSTLVTRLRKAVLTNSINEKK